MRKALIACLFPLALAGCKVDLTGLDFSGDWGPDPSARVTGFVWVGGYAAELEEVTLHFYQPQDTLTPVDSVRSRADGSYERTWWYVQPPSDFCGWLGRAVLWSGEAGALEPLFDGAHRCDPASDRNVAVTLSVDYVPLSQPFVLSGRVLADDVPAQRDLRVRVRSTVRNRFEYTMTTSDVDGYYAFETMSATQRFSWCRWIDAEVLGGTGQPVAATLGRTSDIDDCDTGRRFPDIRFGATKAVQGRVDIIDEQDVARPARAAEARVTLLDPADSTAVTDGVETLDDGSFHIWWPVDTSQTGFPGCDWLIGVELEDERSVIVPMLESTTSQCGPAVYRNVQVP